MSADLARRWRSDRLPPTPPVPGRYRCPACRRSSLSIRIGHDGRHRVLVWCFAGCTVKAVVEAAGWPWARIYADTPDGGRAPRRPQTPADAIRADVQAVVDRYRDKQAQLGPYRPIFQIADYLRHSRRALAEHRARLSTYGDTDRVWRRLAMLARHDRALHALEAELDAVLRTYYEAIRDGEVLR